MGFLQGMGRMIAGKPVFTNEDSATIESEGEGLPDRPGKTPVDERGYKIIPEIAVTRIRPHINGSELEVWAMIQNASDAEVFMDNINFLGFVYQLDRQITPGSSHDFCIYKGQVFTSQPDDSADIYYRLESSGDNFQAHFRVEFDLQNDQFIPKEFHTDGPTRDI